MEVGILDPYGKNPNPLTGEPYSDRYREVATGPKGWIHMPFYEKRYEAIKTFKEYQVTLLVSGTGSGKTVLAPKFMLHALDYKGKIAITNPKKIPTESSAHFAAVTLDVEIGTYVSMKFRGSPSNKYSSESNLVYCTDGLILQKLKNDPMLQEYDCVIIDEAHERNTNIDILLMRLKKLCALREDFKLVIMSATINTELFSNYYNELNFGFLDAGSKTYHPVEEIFSPVEYFNVDKDNNIITKPKDYIESIVDVSVQLLRSTDSGDILVFITGVGEAEECCKLLRNKLEDDQTIFCSGLSGNTKGEEKELVVEATKYKEIEGKYYERKIIFATEVAESSITIDGLEYVIETGLVNSSTYDYSKGLERLDRKFISKASHEQRMGRVGRVGPGMCYNMFTKEQYDKLFLKFPISPIMNQDISSDMLDIIMNENYVNSIPKNFRYKNKTLSNQLPVDLESFLRGFIEKPPESTIQSIIDTIYSLNALEELNDQEYQITTIGRVMNTFGTKPEISRMLVESYRRGCRKEITILAAYLEASDFRFDSLFQNKPSSKLQNYKEEMVRYKKSLEVLSDKNGDCISIIKIYNKWNSLDPDDRPIFCKEHFIKHKILKKTKDEVKQYDRKFRQSFRILNELYPSPTVKNIEYEIIRSIASGYYNNLIQRQQKLWKHYKGDSKLSTIDDTSLVKSNRYLKRTNFRYGLYIVYKSIFNNTKYSFITPL